MGSLPGTTRSAVRFIVSIPCSVRGMSDVPVCFRLYRCIPKNQPDERPVIVAIDMMQVDAKHQRKEGV